MSVALFCYADGKVGIRDIPAAEIRREWRDPVMPAVSLGSWRCDAEPVRIQTRDYTRQGQMLDGRPVFCEAGVRVLEAGITSICRPHERERIDDRHRQAIRDMVSDEYGDRGIVIDELSKDIPDCELERQALVNRAMLALVKVMR